MSCSERLVAACPVSSRPAQAASCLCLIEGCHLPHAGILQMVYGKKKKSQLLFVIWISSARARCIKGTTQKVFVFYGLFYVEKKKKSSYVGLRENFPVLLYLLEIFYPVFPIGLSGSYRCLVRLETE